MQQPIYNFFVIERDRKISLRYSSTFIPRVGDTIALGDHYLRVNDVLMDSAQYGGGGTEHSLRVYVSAAPKFVVESDCEELELNEFCNRLK